jgi:hypothetical protein
MIDGFAEVAEFVGMHKAYLHNRGEFNNFDLKVTVFGEFVGEVNAVMVGFECYLDVFTIVGLFEGDRLVFGWG